MRPPRCPRGIGSALLLSAALALLAAATAEAKKRVVVLPFSGPGGAGAKNGLSRALGKKVTQIRPATYTAMADDLGVDASDAAGVVAVCSKIKCDAVIKGSVAKKGRKFTLTVTVLDGGTGEAIGKRAATVRGARKVAAAGAAIGAQCVALAAKGKFKAGAKAAPPPKPPEPPPEPVAKPPKKPPEEPVAYKPPEPEEKPKRKKRKKRSDDDEGDGDGEDEERVTKRAPRRGKYYGLFDVSASVGLSVRRAVVTVTSTSAAAPAADSTYDGGMYPEFTIRADLFPLVLATKSFPRNIGLGVGYTRHLSISTKTQNDSDPPVETTSQELLLDLRVRWVIFKTITSPEVNIFAGYGMRDFSLSANTVMASFNYRFLRFGLEGNVPLGTPYIGLYAGFDVRPLLAVGQEVVQFLGTKQSGLGFSVRGGAMGRHSSGFFYFLSVEYLRFSTNFIGLLASPDVDPSTIGKLDKRDRGDPTQAADRFIRFWAGAGFMM